MKFDNIISAIKSDYTELSKRAERYFVDFFRNIEIGNRATFSQESSTSIVKIASPGEDSHSIRSAIASLRGKPGLYVILTDYPVADATACQFSIDNPDIKAIYRGHSSNVKERVMGHLINPEYLEYCRSKTNKKPWGSYLKISDGADRDGGNDGGINISEMPYSSYSWYVAVFWMEGSTEAIRETAEYAFSVVWGTPARSSSEPTKGRRRTKSVTSRQV
jgi:hypothetical protein